MSSFPVDSDTLPEDLEKEMHACFKEKADNEQTLTQALVFCSKKDIFHNHKIDMKKLERAIQNNHQLKCLKQYNVNVVAFLLHRYCIRI